MNLTEEIVNKIFMNCYVMKKNEKDDFNDKTKFHIVKLKFPLHNGHRFVIFRNDQLDAYRDVIAELFNNISWLESEEYIPFLGLMKTVDRTRWTNSVYEMEKLYALGIAANVISLKEIDRGLVITRIDQDVKVRILNN